VCIKGTQVENKAEIQLSTVCGLLIRYWVEAVADKYTTWFINKYKPSPPGEYHTEPTIDSHVSNGTDNGKHLPMWLPITKCGIV